MPEISILDPRVLPMVVREYDAPTSFMGHQLVMMESDTQPFWEYDIVISERDKLDTYQTPNSEALLIDQLPVGHMEGRYAYQRVKKQFSPSTTRLLRRVGEGLASTQAGEDKIMEEVEDMRMKMYRAQEFAIWQMIQGSWTYKTDNGGTYSIDYKIPSDLKVAVSTKWDAAGATVVDDVAALKRNVVRLSGYPLTTAYMNAKTMNGFVNSSIVTGYHTNSGTQHFPMLSDQQTAEYVRERTISRWMGINWMEYDDGYVDVDISDHSTNVNAYKPYIPDGMIIFLTSSSYNPFRFKYGPSIDHEAPPNWTGPFTKSWLEPDPSNRQVLMEVQYMPMNINPLRIGILTNII